MKPNQILEKAETVGQFDAPEDLATDGKALYLADGTAILWDLADAKFPQHFVIKMWKDFPLNIARCKRIGVLAETYRVEPFAYIAHGKDITPAG